jgi:hypothetical protein
MGKVALLDLNVMLGNSQSIYECFGQFRLTFLMCIRWDFNMIRRAHGEKEIVSDAWLEVLGACALRELQNDTTGAPLEFRTVAVVLAYLKLLAGTSSADPNVFLGADEVVIMEPMSIRDGAEVVKQYRDYVIYIDEILQRDHADYDSILFLRNIIRLIGGVCVLSGTESALVSEIDAVGGSRNTLNHPWVYLFTRCPRTHEILWDRKKTVGKYEEYLLRQARPLFVEGFFAVAQKATRSISTPSVNWLTPELLSKLKAWIYSQKPKMVTNEGLHGQITLIFAALLTNLPRDVATVEEGCCVLPDSTGFDRVGGSIRQNSIYGFDVRDHDLLIRHHFAMLSTLRSSVLLNNRSGRLSYGERLFERRASYKPCSEDELLNLFCLRDGLRWKNSDGHALIVPSTFAFTQFRGSSGLSDHSPLHCRGHEFEEECIAAAVLASHRYTSFVGTPFRIWLKYLVAELSPYQQFYREVF